jgi:hypothetical protein
MRYDLVGAPLATFELRYETAAALFFRGVLCREVPAHAAPSATSSASRAPARLPPLSAS